jgi:AcrR family transcriptional regulator
MRADARRNRERVLETAVQVFAEKGLSVPIHEIARRAGVGTGTVSRHFPTKEALYDAIVVSRVGHIIDQARPLLDSDDPGAAFFEFFSLLVDAAADNRGLAEAFAGAGFDMATAAERAGYDIGGVEQALLTRAQRSGAVRKDVDAADVKALLLGCLARDQEGRKRMISVVTDGLRPQHS